MQAMLAQNGVKISQLPTRRNLRLMTDVVKTLRRDAGGKVKSPPGANVLDD